MYQHNAFIGNLGRDPEMRYTPSGQAVTKFSIAVTHEYNTAQGEHVKETMWMNVSAWGKLAETCNTYLQKGAKVLVEGRLTIDKETGGPRIWTDKDGKPRSQFELNASSVRFLSGTKSKGESAPEDVSEIGF